MTALAERNGVPGMEFDAAGGAVGERFRKPDGMPAALAEIVGRAVKWDSIRDGELGRIRDHFEGGRQAVSPKYFPKPSTIANDKVWEENKKLLTHVNLVRPAARCWVSVITGGTVRRRVKEAPAAAEAFLGRWVSSVAYEQTIHDWAENAVVYGTAVAVPIFDPETEDMWVWLPDPVSTYIVTDPRNFRRVLAVFEVKPNRIEFTSVWGEGRLSKDEAEFVPRNWQEYLPIAIGYGIDRRHRRECYGISMVRDAVEWSIRCTAVAFNISLLQKQQTRSILKTIGDLEQLDRLRKDGIRAGSSDGSTLELPEGFTADFITPEAKIAESRDVLKMFVGLQAVAESIPQDVVDATLTSTVGSAEAARIRALPIVQQSGKLRPVWNANEEELIVAMAAVIEYHKSSEMPLKRRDVAARVSVEIRGTAFILPGSPNEQTQDAIARVSAGLTTAEAVVLEFNPRASDEELKEMADRLMALQSAQNDDVGKVFQFHNLKGVVTVNEIRDFVGLPPVAGGEALLTDEQAKGLKDGLPFAGMKGAKRLEQKVLQGAV